MTIDNNNVWRKSVSTPVLQRNGDFTLIFLTLWFYPCDFKTKAEFTPSLLRPGNGVNFWTNWQLCPCVFTSVSYGNCVCAPVIDQQINILSTGIVENFDSI